MGWDTYRWETADLTNSGVKDTFSSSSTLDDFLYPPYVSAELLKRMLPKYLFRRYTGKVVDYGKGKGDIAVYRKDTTPLKQRWAGLAEFDSLPNTRMSSKKWAVQVEERGLGFPYTERLNILGQDDPISMIENHVGVSMQSNVDADLLEKAFGFIDLLYVSRITGVTHSLKSITGKYAIQFTTSENGTQTAVGASKVFGVTGLDPVTLTQADITDAGTDIGGAGYAKDTPSIADLKYIKTDLEAKRVPKIGKYFVAIINSAMLYWLLNDTEFKNVVAYSLADRFVEGEIGTVFGFTFVTDDSQVIDDAFEMDVSPAEGIPSVAIILGNDCVREAVALPEQLRRDTPLDAGRFHRLSVLTYRSESPVWFSSESEYRGAIYIGKPQG